MPPNCLHVTPSAHDTHCALDVVLFGSSDEKKALYVPCGHLQSDFLVAASIIVLEPLTSWHSLQ